MQNCNNNMTKAMVVISQVFRKKSLIGKMEEQKSQEEKAIMIKIKNEYLEK